MPKPDDLAFRPDEFSGVARLFPLPNLVLFPHVLQPLHIFEPRYRAMLEEALEGDRLIAMAMLAPGWQSDYEGRPPLYPFACLGRVATHQAVEGNRYNLIVVGLKRVRILRELPPDKPFREAEVEVVDDIYPPNAAAIEARAATQQQLLEMFRRAVPRMGEAGEQLEQLLGSSVSLGMLTDLAAYALDLDVPTKHELLAELNVDRRAARLLKLLKAASTKHGVSPWPGKFPPDFSAN